MTIIRLFLWSSENGPSQRARARGRPIVMRSPARSDAGQSEGLRDPVRGKRLRVGFPLKLLSVGAPALRHLADGREA